MIFSETRLAGAFRIDVDVHEDERGVFARTFRHDEFREHGLLESFVQCNLSFNRARVTLRGMHYQTAPHGEVKLVRCVSSALIDVIIDLRRVSATFGEWIAEELTAENRRSLYNPEGFAHGFMTLTDATEVFYQMGSSYVPGAASGVRWDDPRFGIDWPLQPAVTSERDATYPDFDPDRRDSRS